MLQGDNFLFIGAHPDDIEINAGGTISRLVREGKQVFCAILTNANDEVRGQEFTNSMSLLGTSNYAHWGFTDKKLYLEKMEIIQALDEVVKGFHPDTIFTHGFSDNHQDHITTAECSLVAGRNTRNILTYSPKFPSSRNHIPYNPNLMVKLTKEDIDTKLRALSCHTSQITKYGKTMYLEYMRFGAKSEAIDLAYGHSQYVESFQINKVII